MKIVKLNRNFKIYKDHGFEVGLKFDIWDHTTRDVERAAADRFGNQAWMWKYHPADNVKGDWASAFGERRTGKATPYWIYLRKENMLSLLLLSLENNHG